MKCIIGKVLPTQPEEGNVIVIIVVEGNVIEVIVVEVFMYNDLANPDLSPVKDRINGYLDPMVTILG